MPEPSSAWLNFLEQMRLPDRKPEESADAWTDRIAQSGRALGRFRQCSIGFHDECSDRYGLECTCPCHTMDKGTIAAGARQAEKAIAEAYGARALPAMLEDLVAASEGDPALLWEFAAQVLEITARDFATFYPDRNDNTWSGPDVSAWLTAEAFHVRRRGGLA